MLPAAGSRETFPLSLELAAAGSGILWSGLAEGAADYPISYSDFFRRKLTAYSAYGAQGEPGLESFRYAVRLIAGAAIDVSPLLSHMLPIEEAGEAFRIARMRTGNALKVSIKFLPGTRQAAAGHGLPYRFAGRRSRSQGDAGRAAVPDPGSRRQVPSLFDITLADAGVEVVLSGVRMPGMNAIMERWVQTCHRELLDRTLPGCTCCAHCPHPSPSLVPPSGFTSTDAIASPASSTSTDMPFDLHG